MDVTALQKRVVGGYRDHVESVIDILEPQISDFVRKRHTDREPTARRVILEMYGAMQHAVDTGGPYVTRLDPPPADPRVAHPQRNQVRHV
jgi:hypothetical protein